MKQLVIFTIDENQYAIDLFIIQSVIRAAAVTPLLDAPDIIAGLINIKGKILPVINMRHLFNLPEKDIEPEHQFIIVNTSWQTVAIWVDFVLDVKVLSGQEIVQKNQILPDAIQFDGAVICHDGMVLIYDFERMLGEILLSAYAILNNNKE